MAIDDDEFLMPYRGKSAKHVTGCGEECDAMWPGKGMRSACSYRDVDPKSKHHGEDVPSGFHWNKKGKKLKADDWNGYGLAAACWEYFYPVIL